MSRVLPDIRLPSFRTELEMSEDYLPHSEDIGNTHRIFMSKLIYGQVRLVRGLELTIPHPHPSRAC